MTKYRYRRSDPDAGSLAAQFDLALAATPQRVMVGMFIVALLATGLLGVFAVNAVHAQEQYAHAPNCAVSTPVGGCLDMPNATIESKSDTGGKDPSYLLNLSGPAPADGEIRMANQYPIWNAVSPGDSVIATIWHGKVVAITDYVNTGDTSDAPAIDVILYEGLFFGALMWAVIFALFAFRCRALRNGFAQNWTRRIVPFHIALILGGLGLFLGSYLAMSEGYSLWWDAGTALFLAAIGGAWSAWSAWRNHSTGG